MLPELVVRKGGWRVVRVADEASHSMCVQTEKERNEEMMCVPKGLERLLTNAVVGRGIHQKHTQQHYVTCNAAWLGVVNLDGRDGPYLQLLNVEEAASVRQSQHDRPDRNGLEAFRTVRTRVTGRLDFAYFT